MHEPHDFLSQRIVAGHEVDQLGGVGDGARGKPALGGAGAVVRVCGQAFGCVTAGVSGAKRLG